MGSQAQSGKKEIQVTLNQIQIQMQAVGSQAPSEKMVNTIRKYKYRLRKPQSGKDWKHR